MHFLHLIFFSEPDLERKGGESNQVSDRLDSQSVQQSQQLINLLEV